MRWEMMEEMVERAMQKERKAYRCSMLGRSGVPHGILGSIHLSRFQLAGLFTAHHCSHSKSCPSEICDVGVRAFLIFSSSMAEACTRPTLSKKQNHNAAPGRISKKVDAK